MKTNPTRVIQKVHVWATPKTAGSFEPGEFPFSYELAMSDTYHWRTGAVCVYSADVHVDVPEGINLFEMALATLQAARKQAFNDYSAAIRSIDEEIHKLQLLGAPMVLSGEDVIDQN